MGSLRIRQTTNFPTLRDYKTRVPQSASQLVPESSSHTSNITPTKKNTQQIVKKYLYIFIEYKIRSVCAYKVNATTKAIACKKDREINNDVPKWQSFGARYDTIIILIHTYIQVLKMIFINLILF